MKVADTNERSKNGIVYGLEENEGEQLEKKVEGVLMEIDEKPLTLLANNVSEWERRRMVQGGQ